MFLGKPIEFPHVTLRLVPKTLNAVDVVPIAGEDLQHIVGLPAVGINDAVGDGFALDDRHRGIGPGVGNDLRIDPPTAQRAVARAAKCSIRRSCFDLLNRLFLMSSLITPYGVIWEIPIRFYIKER